MKTTIKIICFLFIVLFISTSAFASVEVDKNALMKKMSALQMPFIENQGQIKDKSVRFYANTFAGTVFVTDKGEIVYSLMKSEDKPVLSGVEGTQNTEHSQSLSLREERSNLSSPNSALKTPDSITKAVTIKESLERHKESKIEGINKAETKVNYFKGAKEDWRTNISTWQEVSIGEVYKGIELKLKAYGNNIEKLFTIHPQGSVEDIKLKLEGAKSLNVNKDGELEVETELGVVKYTKPVAYQEEKLPSPLAGEGKGEGALQNKQYIKVAYVVNGNEYGFKVGKYDNTKPLIIDPLLASTFLGGSSTEGAYQSTAANNGVYHIAIDPNGDIYVAGNTMSSDFPGVNNSFNGGIDIVISKLSGDLTTLYFSTFLGGSNNEEFFRALTLDLDGNVYMAGSTKSSDFPTTPNAYRTAYNGGEADAFISKLSGDLSTLLVSTFLGGSNIDEIYILAIGQDGNIYVGGDTQSSNFPVTPGAYQTTYKGGQRDGFISKLNSDLTH